VNYSHTCRFYGRFPRVSKFTLVAFQDNSGDTLTPLAGGMDPGLPKEGQLGVPPNLVGKEAGRHGLRKVGTKGIGINTTPGPALPQDRH
jgi:hypothetical protein